MLATSLFCRCHCYNHVCSTFRHVSNSSDCFLIHRNTTLRILIRLKSPNLNSQKIVSMWSDWWLHSIWGMFFPVILLMFTGLYEQFSTHKHNQYSVDVTCLYLESQDKVSLGLLISVSLTWLNLLKDMDFLSSVTVAWSAFPLWLSAGVKHVASTSTRGRSSTHAKRPFRTSCTWDCPSSASTSNVLGVLLRLLLRWVFNALIIADICWNKTN